MTLNWSDKMLFQRTAIFVLAFLAVGQTCFGAEAADEGVRRGLAESLTLHASFDKEFSADFARGDKTCYYAQGGELAPAKPGEDVRLDESAGRFGGAMQIVRKNGAWPLFTDGGNLGYTAKRWSGSASVWLKLDPDKDLEPGYCDPVQIVGNDLSKGFIFLEWSPNVPRRFRYAVRPLQQIWNPENVGWEEIPVAKRPLIEVEDAPFSRDKWTHAVFTFEGVNDDSKPQVARLYLNGKSQGAIENWDLSIGWDRASARLVLGASYVGLLDDLAFFDRPLTEREVQYLYESDRPASELRK